jgi:hypothetical protein
MVKHWLSARSSGWRWRLAINAVGAVLTAVVTVVVLVGKAPTSLLVAVIIPLLVGMMLFINRHYRASAEQLAVPADVVLPLPHRRERAIVPVASLSRAVVQAVNVARSMADEVRAVVVSDEPEKALALRRAWEEQMPEIPLDIVDTPYLALAGPTVAYLDSLDEDVVEDVAPITFVILPQYVARHWWERPLYNQSTKALRAALIGRPHTVVVDVPYQPRRSGVPRVVPATA